jgi:cystathionine beta-synthase
MKSTGPEIWRQTAGKVNYFVAGLGTGGTITGTARYLKSKNPGVKVIGADPVGSILKDYFYTKQMVPAKAYKVEGIGEDFIPSIYDFSLFDEIISVNDAQSLNLARRLAREEGILAGGSAGTALFAALQVARRAKEGELVVVLIPDTGERYLSKVHSDAWMRDNRLLDSGTITMADVLRGKGSRMPALVSVNFDEPVVRALALIREFNISQLPVLKDGSVVGVVSEGALFQKVFAGAASEDARVEYFLEKALPTVPLDATLPQVFKILATSNAVVATDAQGKPAGIVTRYDLLEYAAP